MVTKIYACPHCERPEAVVGFGFTDGGRQRLRCKECCKTWTPEGPGRRISAQKEALIEKALIEKALGERLSQRAIARSLSAGRETVRRVLKKKSQASRLSFPGTLLPAVSGDALEIDELVVRYRFGGALSLQASLPLPVACGVALDASGVGMARG